MALKGFKKDTLCGDLRFDLSVSRATDTQADRTGRAVAREPDHTGVVGEIFTAKLGANA